MRRYTVLFLAAGCWLVNAATPEPNSVSPSAQPVPANPTANETHETAVPARAGGGVGESASETKEAEGAVGPAGAAVGAPVAGAIRVSVSQCNVDGPYIAITFDDGPHGTQTPRLLKMLKERGIHATFFLVGQCVAEYPEVARMIVAEGHEIANHSWNHPSLSKMSMEAVRDQLQRTHTVIRQETGVIPTLMRPPYGNFTAAQKAWANATWGYRCILWNVDSNDWKSRSAAKTESVILSETKPGSIILCHDIHKTTIDAMPETLDRLIAKGFKFVTVSELLKLNREKPAPAKTAAVRSLNSKEGAVAVTAIEDLAVRPGAGGTNGVKKR